VIVSCDGGIEELDYDLPKESIERLNGGPVTITPLHREIHGVQDSIVGMTLRALRLSSHHTVSQVTELRVAPDTVKGVVVFGLPRRVVYGATSPTVFEGEVGGVGHIEGDHMIVPMAAEVDMELNRCSHPA
jgi:hypothetical protein